MTTEMAAPASHEACVRKVLLGILILFLIQVSVILIFYKDASLLTLFSFDWIKTHPSLLKRTVTSLKESSSISNNKTFSSRSHHSTNSSTLILTRHSTRIRNVITPVPMSHSVTTLSRRTHTHSAVKLPLCSVIPPNLVGPIKVDTTLHDWPYLEKKYGQNLLRGGRWKPMDCVSRHKVAIVIPYRDRDEHLRLFLQHMHPLLQRQQLDYGIYIVELAPKTKFNRAMLMNIGFAEASKIYDYQCYIFHDVDLYPEDDRNIYSCPDMPRHMSVAVNKFNYKLPYPEIFGGVGALKTEHFKLVNGFSNKFFGWGGEDDDMHNRIVFHKLKVIRYPSEIARYKMMTHKDDVRNPSRFTLLHSGKNRWNVDGLNSLVYKLIAIEYRKLYTWVNVDINMNEIMGYGP